MNQSAIISSPIDSELVESDIETLQTNRRYWEQVAEAPETPRRLHRALFQLHWINRALRERGHYAGLNNCRHGGRCDLQIGGKKDLTMQELGEKVAKSVRF